MIKLYLKKNCKEVIAIKIKKWEEGGSCDRDLASEVVAKFF